MQNDDDRHADNTENNGKAVYEKPEITELGGWQNVTQQQQMSLKSPFWDLFKGG